MTSPFMSILHAFAEAKVAAREIVEREVHHDPSGEQPVDAENWRKVETDNSGYSVWVRIDLLREKANRLDQISRELHASADFLEEMIKSKGRAA